MVRITASISASEVGAETNNVMVIMDDSSVDNTTDLTSLLNRYGLKDTADTT